MGLRSSEGVMKDVRDERWMSVAHLTCGTDRSESQAVDVEMTHSGESQKPTHLV